MKVKAIGGEADGAMVEVRGPLQHGRTVLYEKWPPAFAADMDPSAPVPVAVTITRKVYRLVELSGPHAGRRESCWVLIPEHWSDLMALEHLVNGYGGGKS